MRMGAHTDVEFVVSALARMREKNPGKQMQYTDIATAQAYIESAVDRDLTRVIGGYFIMFDVGMPWYSQESFLLEDLIIRIYPTEFPVKVAIDALSTIAREYGLKAITAGDTQIGHMVPLYHASGFVTLGTQLIKELEHGVAT
jgi:hypothetical protein